MWRETRKASAGVLVIKGRLHKAWALSGKKKEKKSWLWFCRTWRQLKNFFPLVFNTKCSSHIDKVAKDEGWAWDNEEWSAAEDWVWEHLRNLRTNKLMEIDERTRMCSDKATIHYIWKDVAVWRRSHWLEKEKNKPVFRKRNMNTKGTTGQSVSLLSLARSWTRSWQNYAEVHGKQRSNWWQTARLY